MDSGEAFPEPEAAMAKWYASNLAAEFARDGVQIFGGYGMAELAADGSHYRAEESIVTARSQRSTRAPTRSRSS